MATKKTTRKSPKVKELTDEEFDRLAEEYEEMRFMQYMDALNRGIKAAKGGMMLKKKMRGGGMMKTAAKKKMMRGGAVAKKKMMRGGMAAKKRGK